VTSEYSSTGKASQPVNLILSRLPAAQAATLSRHFVPINLPLHFRLFEPNQMIEHVYFPVSGLVSTDVLTESGGSVEVGVIGREGLVGVSALLGQTQMMYSVIMQGSGAGLRIRASVLREEFLKGGALMRMVHSFLYLQMAQTSQSVLCNRLHPVEARLARWLLTSADRMETESLQLTQEFLAQMLGARRSTVTVAAGCLQRAGTIDYSRGKIRIINRPSLEARACECYGIVRSAYDRVLADF
jgi:CRP-like cAMP-binding protein